MAERRATIGLMWHSVSSDNFGVGALTASHLAILDAAAARAGVVPRYRVIGFWEPRTPYVVRADLEVRNLRLKDFANPFGGLHAALRGCDLVLDIGAGDSFADIYGTKRAALMLASKAAALAWGRPLILAPQTLGPFRHGWSRRAAAALMRRARLVATRDRLSTEHLAELVPGLRAMEATDVALRLPYDPPAPRPEGGPAKVGLNVSGLLFNGGYSRDNMFGLKSDYAEMVRELARRFHAREGVELHLVGHVISQTQPVEDDQRVCEALAAELPGAVAAPAFGHPSEAKSYIAGLDFFMGARMHACIAAFSSGVPVLPMAYSRKFAGLFGTLGYDALADCREETAEAILARAEAAFEDREALAARTREALARGLARLEAYEAELASALKAAAL